MEKKAISMEELLPILRLQMKNGGKAFLTVTGTSMLPMVKPLRDRVWLKEYCGNVHCGDVILYRRDNGQYVLHRIVKHTQPLTCCGDNQWQKERVEPSQVIAVVTAFDRNGKHHCLSAWTYRLYTWLMVALFPLRRPYIAIRRAMGRHRRAYLNKRNK